MADADDDLFDKDSEFDQFAEEYEVHRDALFALISEYVDEHELEEGYVAQMLLDLTISMRMTAYGIGVEKPSAAGLRLDLDRFQRDVIEFVRQTKKGAEGCIQAIKEARAVEEKEPKTG
jgi:hypothetical protein